MMKVCISFNIFISSITILYYSNKLYRQKTAVQQIGKKLKVDKKKKCYKSCKMLKIMAYRQI